jgi:L-ascorbate metabolism protein UlaG (beta-lactamase superfamily)
MKHLLTAFACGLLFAGAVGAAGDEEKNVTIRWHGQSFFEIQTSAGTKIVLDPHGIEELGRPDNVSADLVICSHRHTDHTRVDLIKDAGKVKKTLVYGVDGDQVGKQKWNEVKEAKFKDVTYTIVGTYHDDTQGLKRGLNSVIILEIDGLRIVHLGDLGHTLTEAQIKKIGKVDVLMVPVGGIYTLNGSDAKEVVEQLTPTRYILPMHYGTPTYSDLLPATEFLDEPKYKVEKSKSNELVIDPSAKVTKPVIKVLNWAEK